MRRRLIALTVLPLLLFVACGDDDNNDSASSSSSSGGPQTLEVYVDSPDVSTVPVAFTAYFPAKVTAHPGDTVKFESNFTGEPHSVTFGTLVDSGLEQSAAASSGSAASSASSASGSAASSEGSGSGSGSGAPPATDLDKIPVMLPDGPGDAIQSAAQPCFLESGDPPATDACTADQQKQPDFDGTYPYFNSGFLADGDAFSVKLADDLEPGTYSYMCNLHRQGMTGTVTVVAAADDADTSEEAEKRGDDELKAAQDGIAPVVDAINDGTLPPAITTATPGGVIAGGGSQDLPSAIPVVFGPKDASVKVGEAVTWTVVGPHTISFGTDEALRTFIQKAPDGAVHLNPDSFAPIDGAGQPQPSSSASAPPSSGGPPVLIDGGSYDGTKAKSSGLILSFPPSLFQYKLTFTKAGSYTYVCLIHPDMEGTVNVT